MKAISTAVARRLQSLPLESYLIDSSTMPNIEIPVSHIRVGSVFTPPGSFDTRASLPFAGTLGASSSNKPLPMESCDANDLWKLGIGYRVVSDTASGNSVAHGATRTLK